MDVSFECWCGHVLDLSGAITETESDLRAECEVCGRGYVITVTQYKGPNGSE